MSKNKSEQTKGKKNQTSGDKQNRWTTLLLQICYGTLLAVNILSAILMMISAYGGYFEVEDYPVISVSALAFPLLFVITFILWTVWLVWRKWRTAIIMILPFLICIQQIYAFFPLGGIIPKKESGREGNKFTLLTYNIMQWEDFKQRELPYNPTMSAVIKMDADIVALQECYSFEMNKSGCNISLTQLDSLYKKYPYRVVSTRDLALLSKYPIVSTSNISADSYSYAAAKYEVELPCGDIVTLFNVHLQSIGLSDDDKAEYQSVVSKQIIEEKVDSIKGTLKYLRHFVYPKLAAANVSRAAQARIINAIVKKEAGRVVLCGDFNDIPYSFSYRKIKGRMKDLYTERGFGPAITFHANKLYFRIDQVLYKGNLVPLDISKKSYPCSDHYPLIAKFETNN